MNTTLHGKYRYATRVLSMKFRDEKDYKEWQKKNEAEDTEIKVRMLQHFEYCELVYEGKIGDAEENCKYYVDLDNMVTFIVNGENIVTCYNIFFDMGEEVDKQTANIIFKEIRKLQKQFDKEQKNIRRDIELIDFNIKSTKNEIERVEEILDTLKLKLSNFNSQKDVIIKATNELEYNIEKLSTKLCYSCQLKNDFKFK